METTEVKGPPSFLVAVCTKQLEAMRNPKADNRPKTLAKLKNTLQKNTRVMYVTSVLNAVFTTEGSVEICKITPIQRKDEELDQDIIERAQKLADERGRQLFVLPCDSNLHEDVASQLQNWLEIGRGKPNMEDPVLEVTKACMVDCDLCADQVVEDLARLGYVRLDGGSVDLSLPEGLALEELKKALEELKQEWEKDLGQVSIRGYHSFATALSRANVRVQQRLVEDIDIYCEDQFSRRYQVYSKTNTEMYQRTRTMQQLHVTERSSVEMDTSSPPADTKQEMPVPQELPSAMSSGLPLNITPEVARIVLHLSGLAGKPSTVQELVAAIEPLCSVVYVVSPKFVLSRVSKKDRFSVVPKGSEFTIELNIGNHVERQTVCLQDTFRLADILQFNINAKKKPDPLRTAAQHRFFALQNQQPEAMETNTIDGSKNPRFQDFQEFVLEQAKIKAQRYQYVIVLNDKEAQDDCKRQLGQWLNTRTGTETTADDFTNALLGFSMKMTKLPVDTLIKFLEESKYLSVSGMKVTYASHYQWSPLTGETDQTEEEMNFRTAWTKDYIPGKAYFPREGAKETAPFPVTRKRPMRRGGYGRYYPGVKRQKVIKL